MRRVLFPFLLILSIILIQGPVSGDDNLKMDPALRASLASGKSHLLKIASWPEKYVGADIQQGDLYLEVFLETSLSRNDLSAFGIKPHTKTGEIFTASVPYDQIHNLASMDEVKSISLSVMNEFMLDVSTANTGTDMLRLGCNAQAAWDKVKGKDVIIGIVDSGIDWEHGDFIKDPDSSNQSRILYLWDQTLTAQSGETGPSFSGLNYGVEYSRSWIEDELTGVTSGKVRSRDTGGHGTHVAGITGGDGSASDGSPPAPTYIGVAPEAEFVIVKSNMLSSGIIDGVNYVFQIADNLGKPAVVNLSLGNHYGPHDGTSDFETSIDNLTGPGKLVVASAGNDTGDKRHAEDTLSASGSSTTRFNVPSSPGVNELWIDAWVDNGDTYNVSVTAPDSTVVGPVSPGNTDTQQIAAYGEVYIENLNAGDHPEGDKEIFIRVIGIDENNITSGDWSFTLERSQAGGDGAFDAWITQPGNGVVQFLDNVTEEELIANPASARKVIAVAAHVTKIDWTAQNGNSYYLPGINEGEIAYFSSVGPTRDTPSDPGYQKPEICAPGMVISSALSQDYSADPARIADDGKHRLTQGTSMSAPHVTGALALFLDKDSSLTSRDALEALIVSAWDDVETGIVPNTTWGYGKLNILDGLAEFTAAKYWHLYQ